ncbi:unnamed protein product [Prunus brigantina]
MFLHFDLLTFSFVLTQNSFTKFNLALSTTFVRPNCLTILHFKSRIHDCLSIP